MQTILQAESLVKSYGRLRAVDHISFEVFRGEIFGFLGPNGAGKTTTMKMMSGLLKPDMGSVTIHANNHRQSIGICPQHIVVWENLTCMEQIVYMGQMYNMPARQARVRGHELLESLGLLDKKNRLAKTLSGGMLRRLNIALALIHSPELVFLDEPQAGLDPQSRVLVREYIRSIKNKTTVILTTHDMEEAEKLSDRICIIDRGRVLVSGVAEEIKKLSGQEDVIEVELVGDMQQQLIPFLNMGANDYTLQSSNTASFKIKDPLVTMDMILRVVRERGLEVSGLRLRKKSLEDIFIHLTGRSIRE